MATLDEFIAQETSAIEDLKPLYKLADTKIEYTSEEYDLIIKARANKLFDEQENGWKKIDNQNIHHYKIAYTHY